MKPPVSRRAVAQGVAWSIPSLAVASIAPAVALSCPEEPTVETVSYDATYVPTTTTAPYQGTGTLTVTGSVPLPAGTTFRAATGFNLISTSGSEPSLTATAQASSPAVTLGDVTIGVYDLGAVGEPSDDSEPENDADAEQGASSAARSFYVDGGVVGTLGADLDAGESLTVTMTWGGFDDEVNLGLADLGGAGSIYVPEQHIVEKDDRGCTTRRVHVPSSGGGGASG